MVNDSMPGPTIYVHRGDTVYVNVTNQGYFGVTLHWYLYLSLSLSANITLDLLIKQISYIRGKKIYGVLLYIYIYI